MLNKDYPNKAIPNRSVQMHVTVTFAYVFLLIRWSRKLISMIMKFSIRGIETEMSGLNGQHLKHHPKASLGRRAEKVLFNS